MVSQARSSKFFQKKQEKDCVHQRNGVPSVNDLIKIIKILSENQTKERTIKIMTEHDSC